MKETSGEHDSQPEKKTSDELDSQPEKKRARRIIKRIFLCSLLAFLGLIIISLGILGVKFGPDIFQWYVESRQIAENSDLKDFRTSETSYLYAADGSQLLKLKQDRDVVYVDYESLPEHVLESFIAIEDKRFYKHGGIDWLSTAKAIYLLIKYEGKVVRGGSTITQQLARNVYLSFETSYERKIREIFLALELEKRYTKEQILEFYINNINYANGYYGIGAAAKGYFDKEVSELTVDETAFLCGIPNNPSYYNPRTNYENTVKRRDLILDVMYEQGYLTKKEWVAALGATAVLVEQEEDYYDYAASYALDCAVRAVMKKSGFEFLYMFDDMEEYKLYREEYQSEYIRAKDILSSGGYRVYTSIDLEAQKELQQVIDESLEKFQTIDEEGNYVIQGAATAIDNSSGAVIAIVGGRSQEDSGYLSLNRAFQSYRQPGSTIKPLIVYTPALENGYTAKSRVKDTPISGGPSNSDNRYLGTISLRTAVEKSKNVVAWRLIEELTPKKGLSYIQNMEFNRIVPDDYYASAALGGLTYGVTTVEMASGYSALYNDGIWRDATCIVKVLDNEGNDITDERETKQAFLTDAAYAMTDILTGVAKNGTATSVKLENGHEFACKTGTTNDNKEGWFCGYTGHYTVAVYVGADVGQTIQGLWGGTYPANIWMGIQNRLLVGKIPIPLLKDSYKKDSQETQKKEEYVAPVEEVTEEIEETVENEPVQEEKLDETPLPEEENQEKEQEDKKVDDSEPEKDKEPEDEPKEEEKEEKKEENENKEEKKEESKQEEVTQEKKPETEQVDVAVPEEIEDN